MNIDIAKFGAINDGIKDNTKEIQLAIDECSKSNDTIVLKKGIYKTGTIIIKDNTHIIFEDGAVLSGAESLDAYTENETLFVDAVGKIRGKALVIVYKAKNVCIEGKGIITGNGSRVKVEDDRPFLFRVSESENVVIKDVKLQESISWCLHISKSKNIDIENITVYNRGLSNNDGVDIDSSSNVKMSDCDISSGDDGICIKSTSNVACDGIFVKNCRVSTDWGAFKIGTESVGDIKNIEVEDCEFYDVVGGGIKIVPTDGAEVKNVFIKNIVMKNCTGPIFIANGERNREYANEKRDDLSRIENVVIENVKADVVAAPFRCYYDGEEWGNAIGGIILSGTQKNKLKNITLKNMELSLPGGYLKDINYNVREMGAMYPEFHRFDPVPAKGIYMRHADGIKIENVNITYKDNDVREEIYKEDVINDVIE